MKKIILLFLILLTKLILAEDTTKVIIGYDYMSKSNIYGDVRPMPKDFHKIFVDTINNNLYAHYKTKDIVVKNQVVCYDLITLKEKWSRLFEHQSILFFHNKIYYFTSTKTYKINPNTGKDIWVEVQRIEIVNKTLEYGLKLTKSETPFSMKLVEVNLEDGKEISSTNTPRALPIQFQNDDVLINLGILNLYSYDGFGYSYTDISPEKNEYHRVYSNYIIDSNYFYQALGKTLMCRDRIGSIRWQTEIPQQNHSKYSVSSSSSSIYLIGLGRSSYTNYPNYRRINSPFIAEYDKTTGNNLFFIDNIPISKKDYIIDFIKVDSLIFLRTKNNIIQFNIYSRTFKVKVQYNKGLFYKVKGFLPNNTFIETDSNIVSGLKINHSGLVLIAFEGENEIGFIPNTDLDKVKFYQLDENLNNITEIIKPKIFNNYKDTIHTLISSIESSKNELLQINKDLSILKRFYFNSVPFHFNGSFYTFDQNNLIIGKSSDYTE